MRATVSYLPASRAWATGCGTRMAGVGPAVAAFDVPSVSRVGGDVAPT